jgi:hypothetical protein
MRIVERGVRTSFVIPVLAACFTLNAIGQDSSLQAALPDSPGSIVAQKLMDAGSSRAQTPSASQAQPETQSTPQQTQNQSQTAGVQSSTGTQKPVGTAAAEKPATTGAAASNPAGVAMAPAKQRRVRTLLIKIGAIAGAGVAIGAVAALTTASPSRPPGSR